MERLKALVRDAVAQTLFFTGISRPQRACRGKLLILTFHRVLPQELRRQYPSPGLAVTPEELHWIIAALMPHFDVHVVSDAIRRLQEGRPERPILAITFDDGQWDNLHYAAPILQRLTARASFYVPTDFIGQSGLLWHDEVAFAWSQTAVENREAAMTDALKQFLSPAAGVSALLGAMKRLEPQEREDAMIRLRSTAPPAPEWARLMTWEEVAALQRMGHEIGSHSCSHALLPQLDDELQTRELEMSKRSIETNLGSNVQSMCYPNGSYDARSITLSAKVGYSNAVTTRWGINDFSQPVYELLRCDMDARRLLDRRGLLSEARLAMRLSGLQPRLAA